MILFNFETGFWLFKRHMRIIDRLDTIDQRFILTQIFLKQLLSNKQPVFKQFFQVFIDSGSKLSTLSENLFLN